MTLHLKKGEVLRLEGEDIPGIGVVLPIEVDKDEMIKSHLWLAKSFDSLSVPAELYIDFVDSPSEREALGYRGALVAYAVIDIGIPIQVSALAWKTDYVMKERTRILQGLADIGPFMLNKDTKIAWEYLKSVHELPAYITPSTLVSLKAIHSYISGGMGMSEHLLPLALLGCWSSIMADSTLSFLKM